MMRPVSPVWDEDDADSASETDELDTVLTFKHVRTASVILPSGDRVRKKVSLMSIDENSVYESTALLDSGRTNGPAYSSATSDDVDRAQSRATRWFSNFMFWLRSEAFKR